MADNDQTFISTERPNLKPIVFENGDLSRASKELAAKAMSFGRLVPVDAITVIPGFNARIYDAPSYRASHDALVESIMENGFLPTKPLSGFPTMVDGKDVIMLTDGHRRLAAVHEAISRNAPITELPVVMRPKTTSAEDLTLGLILENGGSALTMIERAIVVKRLSSYGMKPAEIAKKLSVSDTYIHGLLLLVNSNKVIRDLVITEQVSGSDAIACLRKHSDSKANAENAVREIAAAKATKLAKRNAKEAGSTAKSTTTDSGPRLLTNKVSFVGVKGSTLPLADLPASTALLISLVGDSDWYVLGSEPDTIEMVENIEIAFTVKRHETVEQVAQRELAEKEAADAKAAEKAAKQTARDAEKATKKAEKAEKDAAAATAAAAKPAETAPVESGDEL